MSFREFIEGVGQFKQFHDKLKVLPNKEKGDLFEQFTVYLFKLHPWYSDITKEIWLLDDVPPSHLEKIKIPEKDYGIDLVLLDTDGKYSAIQCKYRQHRHEIISWAELATFVGLTFGTSGKFKRGYLVTNTYDITKNVENAEKVVSIYGNFFDDNMPDGFFEKIRNYIDGKKQKGGSIKAPRKYQRNIIFNALNHYTVQKETRGYAEMICGSGKTLLSLWLNNNMSNNLTIVAVPSLYLLSQFYKDWVFQMIDENKKAKFILVGSDADIGDTKYHNNGMILTTNPDDIIQNIKKNSIVLDGKRHLNKIIIITTYQSSEQVILALNKLKIQPDFCIFDEAHKTVGYIKKQFCQLLSDDNIKIKKRFYMTATPKIYSGDDNEDIASMDNEELYGKCIGTYNAGQAIKQKYLSDYQIVTLFTDDEYVKNIIKENKVLSNKVLSIDDSHNIASAIMLLNAIKDKSANHIVTYHKSIKMSKKFKVILERLATQFKMDVKVFQLDGNSTMKSRTKLLKEFKEADTAIISNVKVLNEGINVPIIDAICFVDAKQSTIDILQCFGRSLRLHKDKKYAKIFIPIILDDIDDFDESKVFGNLIKVIKSLSSTDYRLVEYFKAETRGKNRNRHLITFKNYMSKEIIGENFDMDDWFEKVGYKIWKRVDSWSYKYEKFKEWVEKNNKLPVCTSNDPTEKILNAWYCYQKQYKKLLTNKKIKLLEKVKLWNWGFDDLWNDKFEELKEYIKKYDEIPKGGQNENQHQKKLANWCSAQRTSYKDEKLSQNKINKLNSVEEWFWSNKDILTQKWYMDYEKVKKYIDNNNKYPSSENKNSRKLGQFCIKQRGIKNKLSKKQQELLEKLPDWYWLTDEMRKPKERKDRPWDETYELVKKWIITNKRCPSSDTEVKDNIERSYGNWVKRQRAYYKKNKLNDEKIKKLEDIQYWFWEKKDPWDDIYNEYVLFCKDNDNIPAARSKQIKEKTLANWARRQRLTYKNKKLDNSRINKLNKIKSWYWNDEDKWMKKYNDAKIFIEKNNKKPSAISKNVEEKSTARWLEHQSTLHRNNKLDDKYVQLLKTLKE